MLSQNNQRRLRNILHDFGWIIALAALGLIGLIVVLGVNARRERTAGIEATRKSEGVAHAKQVEAEEARQRLEESNRLARIQETERKEQARLWLEENIRLVKIQEAERQKQEQEQLAAERKAYKTRHLGNPNTRYSIAILVANETNQPNAPLGHALAALLNTNGLTTTASLFTPEFIADGLFVKTIAGSKESFDKLELTNFVQAVLLAHQSFQYSTNSALNGLITATMTVDLNTFSTSAFQLLLADSIRAAGAGISRLAARAMAEERILKQLKDGRLGSVQKAVLIEGK